MQLKLHVLATEQIFFKIRFQIHLTAAVFFCSSDCLVKKTLSQCAAHFQWEFWAFRYYRRNHRMYNSVWLDLRLEFCDTNEQERRRLWCYQCHGYECWDVWRHHNSSFRGSDSEMRRLGLANLAFWVKRDDIYENGCWWFLRKSIVCFLPLSLCVLGSVWKYFACLLHSFLFAYVTVRVFFFFFVDHNNQIKPPPKPRVNSNFPIIGPQHLHLHMCTSRMLRAHREGRREETSVLTTGSITDTEYISRSQIIVFLSLLAHPQFQTLHSCIRPSPAWGHRRLFDLSVCIVEVGSCFNWVSCFSKAGIHPQSQRL